MDFAPLEKLDMSGYPVLAKASSETLPETFSNSNNWNVPSLNALRSELETLKSSLAVRKENLIRRLKLFDAVKQGTGLSTYTRPKDDMQKI